ncbi:MAG: AbrB/MazE/SpoVT family DNA-binding domain-containing protein [Chloroflexi bacterium]|nr:AbrB/MazE/SpoVT family DNA-binding domain-containing protein [Chloroflexota bacterium]
MKTHLIRIGNSRGIRIPRAVVEQCRFGATVELEVHDGALLVRPVDQPRLGWDEAFRRMAEHGDDALTDTAETPPSRWDESEWEW